MKITTKQLKQIIKEELSYINESDDWDDIRLGGPYPKNSNKMMDLFVSQIKEIKKQGDQAEAGLAVVVYNNSKMYAFFNDIKKHGINEIDNLHDFMYQVPVEEIKRLRDETKKWINVLADPQIDEMDIQLERATHKLMRLNYDAQREETRRWHAVSYTEQSRFDKDRWQQEVKEELDNLINSYQAVSSKKSNIQWDLMELDEKLSDAYKEAVEMGFGTDEDLEGMGLDKKDYYRDL